MNSWDYGLRMRLVTLLPTYRLAIVYIQKGIGWDWFIYLLFLQCEVEVFVPLPDVSEHAVNHPLVL